MQRGVIARSAVHLASNLFEFHQAAVEIFGMQEKNRLTMGTDFRLSRSQNAGSLCFQMVARCKDVFDLVANVVHAARRSLLEEGGNRRILAKRLEKFDLGVFEFNEDDGHTMFGKRLRLGHLGAERIAIACGRGREIRNGDGNVIDAAEHVFLQSLRAKIR